MCGAALRQSIGAVHTDPHDKSSHASVSLALRRQLSDQPTRAASKSTFGILSAVLFVIMEAEAPPRSISNFIPSVRNVRCYGSVNRPMANECPIDPVSNADFALAPISGYLSLFPSAVPNRATAGVHQTISRPESLASGRENTSEITRNISRLNQSTQTSNRLSRPINQIRSGRHRRRAFVTARVGVAALFGDGVVFCQSLKIIGAGSPPCRVAFAQHVSPRGIVGAASIGQHGTGPCRRRRVDGRGDDRATRRRWRWKKMLDVDFGDGAVDATATSFALGGASVVVHAELGVVFREQWDVFVEE